MSGLLGSLLQDLTSNARADLLKACNRASSASCHSALLGILAGA